MDYLALSLASNEVVAEGRAVVVSFDYAVRKKAPLPQTVREHIYQLEQLSGGMH